MSSLPLNRQQQGIRRTLCWLLLMLAGSVAFTIALVPLYDVFCELTGINGKGVNSAQVLQSTGIDQQRNIEVQMITRTAAGMDWHFSATLSHKAVHPGEIHQMWFRMQNLGSTTGRARAVPSLSPAEASNYFLKLECFCFNDQQLAAGESLEVPVVFQIRSDLPEDLHRLTLAYTLYPQTGP